MKLRLQIPLLVISFVLLTILTLTLLLSSFHYRAMRRASASAVRFINSSLQVTAEKFLLTNLRERLEFERMNLTLNKSLSQAARLDGVVYIAVLDTQGRLLQVSSLRDPAMIFGSARRQKLFDLPALRRDIAKKKDWPRDAVEMEFGKDWTLLRERSSRTNSGYFSHKQPKARIRLFRYRTPIEYEYHIGSETPVVRRLGYIETAVSRDYIMRGITRSLRGLIIPALIILGGLLAMVFFLTRHILNAIDILSAGTQKLSEGKWETRISLKSRNEFGDWARIFNSMAENQEKVLYTLQNKYAEIRRLFKLASEDALTHVFTRRHLMNLTESVVKYEGLNGHIISVLMIDIDHFKAFNDTYGHQTGDAVLQQTARLLYENSRKERDIVGRYGGEEFLVVLPGIDRPDALAVADKIRLLIASTRVQFHDRELSVTISIGVTTASAAETDASTMISRADHALYEAKESGRNRVSFYSGEEEPPAEPCP